MQHLGGIGQVTFGVGTMPESEEWYQPERVKVKGHGNVNIGMHREWIGKQNREWSKTGYFLICKMQEVICHKD